MSRYDLFRRRIAPIAFFLAIGLIVRDQCEHDKRTHTSVELSFGDEAANVRAVSAEVISGAESIAAYHRVALPGSPIGPCKFPLALPDEDGELRIEVDLGASHRQVTKKFHALEGSTMIVPVFDSAGR